MCTRSFPQLPSFASAFTSLVWILLQALPPGGIYIFASQLHTHLAGRGVRTVLVRAGEELEVVQEDQHFSAHYQVAAALLGNTSMKHVLPARSSII